MLKRVQFVKDYNPIISNQSIMDFIEEKKPLSGQIEDGDFGVFEVKIKGIDEKIALKTIQLSRMPSQGKKTLLEIDINQQMNHDNVVQLI